MPDQSSAASEHAIIQEITAPLATMPDDPVSVAADPHFPVAIRGYDRHRRRRLRQADQSARRRAPGDAFSRGRDQARARARRGADLGDPAARTRHRRADHVAVAQRGRGPARGGAPGGRAITAAAEERSRSSTPTPTGSGPSASGSSRTPASSRASCSGSPTPRPSGSRPAETSEEPVLGDRPEPGRVLRARRRRGARTH